MKLRIFGACLYTFGVGLVAGCGEPEPAIPAAAQDINPYIKAEDRLIHAIEKENVAAVSEALNTGSDPNSPGSGELPPLEVAASRGFVEAGKLLVARGAEIDRVPVTKVPGENGEMVERRGNAAVHTAVATGQIEFVKWLIENKTDISLRNGRDSTPLDIAKNSADMLKAREELARDPEMIADIAARMAKTQEIIKLLEEHGAKTTQDFESKKLEDIKGGGIIGSLPPEIRGATVSPKEPDKKKGIIESLPPEIRGATVSPKEPDEQIERVPAPDSPKPEGLAPRPQSVP